MARYYGTIQGARGPASRLGHKSSGLQVTAQSYQGDVCVTFYADGDNDCVRIYVRPHAGSNGAYTTLYSGPVSDLLKERATLVERTAKQKLEEEFA